MPEPRSAHPLNHETYDGVAPPVVWAGTAAVFRSSFSAAPYFEDPEELSQILDWGPERLEHAGGRLVVARSEWVVAGFALAHRLDGDESWLGNISSLHGADQGSHEMLLHPESTLVVDELAVDPKHRGMGVARSCLAAVLAGRRESRVVLGAFKEAREARSMYERWGLTDIGGVPIQDGAVEMRVLAGGLSELHSRLAYHGDHAH